MWRRTLRRSHQAVTLGSPSVRYSVHNEHASSRDSTALHKHTHPSGQWLPLSATWLRDGSANPKDTQAMLERDPTLVSSGQCVVPTVRGFYMFNTVTNSRNYMARVSKLEIALRWAPDVRQVCSGSVPAFFLRCLAWFATAPFHCFPS